MTRVNPYTELRSRDSAIVKAALKRKCEVCKAKPGDDCVSTIDGKPLGGRIVHYARTAE